MMNIEVLSCPETLGATLALASKWPAFLRQMCSCMGVEVCFS